MFLDVLGVLGNLAHRVAKSVLPCNIYAAQNATTLTQTSRRELCHIQAPKQAPIVQDSVNLAIIWNSKATYHAYKVES